MNTIDLQELIDRAFSYYTEEKPWIVELLEAQGRVFNPLRFDAQCLKLMKDEAIVISRQYDGYWVNTQTQGQLVDEDYNLLVLRVYVKIKEERSGLQ